MGNPHCVIFQKEDVDDLDLTRIGPKFEHHPLFPERVNTEFVNVLPDGSLKMRVWERGSGETWACGTGSCATGVAACLNGFANKNEDIVVHLRGGDLTIRYTDETVFMTGAATTVFKGANRDMTKYIFVTGGVVSGLGKGITAASLGRLLKRPAA